jgi:hypothetical protein
LIFVFWHGGPWMSILCPIVGAIGSAIAYLGHLMARFMQ